MTLDTVNHVVLCRYANTAIGRAMRETANVRRKKRRIWRAKLTWQRQTTSNFVASISTTLPLPSSPHWAPSTTVTCKNSQKSVHVRLELHLVRRVYSDQPCRCSYSAVRSHDSVHHLLNLPFFSQEFFSLIFCVALITIHRFFNTKYSAATIRGSRAKIFAFFFDETRNANDFPSD